MRRAPGAEDEAGGGHAMTGGQRTVLAGARIAWPGEGGRLVLSAGLCALAGLAPVERGIGRVAALRAVHPGDRPFVRAALADSASPGRSALALLFRIRGPSGWVWVHGRIVRGPRGARAGAVHYLLSDRDVRAPSRRAADLLGRIRLAIATAAGPHEALDRAAELIGRYLDAGQVGIAHVDPQGEYARIERGWNDGTIFLVRGSWRMDDFGPEFIAEMRAGRMAAIPDLRHDPRTSRPDHLAQYQALGVGAIITVPFMDGGRLVNFLFVHASAPRDWTALQLATVEKACALLADAVRFARWTADLEAREARFAIAAGGVGMVVWEWDVAAGRLHHSGHLDCLLGLAPGTIRAPGDVLGLIHPQDLSALEINIVDALAGTGPEAFDTVMRVGTAGAERWIRVFGAVTARSGAGQGIRAHGFAVDVTAAHQLEARLAATEDRLQKASRLSAMGVFAATLAHELNQPLTALANHLSILAALAAGQDRPGETMRQSVLLAQNQTRRASDIIRRMRKLVTGGGRETVCCPLRDIVDAAVRGNEDRIRKQRIQLDIAYADPDMAIDVDPIQIEQVVYNLVRNACEAVAGVTRPRICIRASTDGESIALTIADNGPGLAPEIAARLFEPLATSKPEGMGLGLSICRSIMEAHNGRIGLLDAEEGAAFRISLPVAACCPPAPAGRHTLPPVKHD